MTIPQDHHSIHLPSCHFSFPIIHLHRPFPSDSMMIMMRVRITLIIQMMPMRMMSSLWIIHVYIIHHIDIRTWTTHSYLPWGSSSIPVLLLSSTSCFLCPHRIHIPPNNPRELLIIRLHALLLVDPQIALRSISRTGGEEKKKTTGDPHVLSSVW